MKSKKTDRQPEFSDADRSFMEFYGVTGREMELFRYMAKWERIMKIVIALLSVPSLWLLIRWGISLLQRGTERDIE